MNKILLPTEKKITWKQVTCQRLTVFAMEQVVRSTPPGIKKILGKDYLDYKKVGLRGYVSEELHKEFFHFLSDNPLAFFESVFKKLYHHCSTALTWFEPFSKQEFSHLDEESAKRILLLIDKKIFPFGETYPTPLLLEDVFDDKLKNILLQFPKEEREECRQVLSTPTKVGYSGTMEKELLTLCLHQPSKQEIYDFTEKWGWINLKFFFGTPLTIEEVTSRLVSPKKAKEKIKEMEEQEKKVAQKQQEYFMKLSSKERQLIRLLQENTHFRTYRLDVTALIGYYLIPFFTALAKLRGIPLEDIGLYRLQELIHNSLAKEERDKRRLGCTIIMLDGKITLISGEEAEQDKRTKLEASSVQGKVANKGIARGPAKIVFEKKDLVKIREGDVLITEMSYPDYNMAMAKSAAIVTDLGGVTSHAAITSRELGKPCIIDTKIATKIFNDGDVVEVDANRGIVRKVKQ